MSKDSVLGPRLAVLISTPKPRTTRLKSNTPQSKLPIPLPSPFLPQHLPEQFWQLHPTWHSGQNLAILDSFLFLQVQSANSISSTLKIYRKSKQDSTQICPVQTDHNSKLTTPDDISPHSKSSLWPRPTRLYWTCSLVTSTTSFPPLLVRFSHSDLVVPQTTRHFLVVSSSALLPISSMAHSFTFNHFISNSNQPHSHPYHIFRPLPRLFSAVLALGDTLHILRSFPSPHTTNITRQKFPVLPTRVIPKYQISVQLSTQPVTS